MERSQRPLEKDTTLVREWLEFPALRRALQQHACVSESQSRPCLRKCPIQGPDSNFWPHGWSGVAYVAAVIVLACFLLKRWVFCGKNCGVHSGILTPVPLGLGWDSGTQSSLPPWKVSLWGCSIHTGLLIRQHNLSISFCFETWKFASAAAPK